MNLEVAVAEFDLERFVSAQGEGAVFDRAVAELERGRKSSHWMWFVFPQIRGLGSSPMAVHYALAGLEEARSYLAHPVLGPRLRRITQVVAESKETDAQRMFGGIDALKLRSSMTLFARADPDESLFQTVLDRFFDGRPDPATLSKL